MENTIGVTDEIPTGQSGNPAGRPAGSLNKKTLAVAAAYEAKAEEAVTDIMERSKSGDPAAMRLIMEWAIPRGRHRRFAFALPRIRTPEDAEAAIDVVMDGLAEGLLSLPDVAELLRLIERLLAMAESIQEMKRVRDFIARRPSADGHQDAVQAALADVLAAVQERNAEEAAEREGADALYFPVNQQADGGAGTVEGPSKSPVGADPSPAGRDAAREPIAA